MSALIYVTEDDESIRQLIEMSLGSFSYKVRAFETAEETIDMCETMLPDLFIFDIMLPKMDGVSAVKLLRTNEKTKELPALFLTAKDTEIEKVVGLDAGADDYLTKPFGVMELGARVRALLRRTTKTDEIICGSIKINCATREVFQSETPVDLTFKEFELLSLLIKNKDRVMAREVLLNTIWGYDFLGETRTLDAHIKTIRQKLGEQFIKTVRNVGYRFSDGEL